MRVEKASGREGEMSRRGAVDKARRPRLCIEACYLFLRYLRRDLEACPCVRYSESDERNARFAIYHPIYLLSNNMTQHSERTFLQPSKYAQGQLNQDAALSQLARGLQRRLLC